MKKIRLTTTIKVMLVFLFAVCVIPQSKAADLKAGLSAYNKGDWKTALKEFQPLADQGEVEAQTKLAVMYREGRGVTQDYNLVVKWYSKAAEQGDNVAQYNLGELYKSGEGLPRNDKEAIRWYTKSANQGNADAQYQLGRMYFNGKGVSQDFTEAAKWYIKSAKQGNADAQRNLDFMKKKGLGIDHEDVEAVKLDTKLVDDSVDENQQDLLKSQKKNNLAATQVFTEIDRLDSKPLEQSVPAVQHENSSNINNVSSVITKKNPNQADPVLLFSLGWKYFNGDGVKKDNSEAFKWFSQSASLGYAKAEYRLGDMFHYGFGIPKNHKEALKWYTRSAMQGNKSAQHSLAIIYDRGEESLHDPTKAYTWITIAASQGHIEATNYGDYYYKVLNSSQRIEAEKLAKQLHIKIYGTALQEDKFRKYKRQIIAETESFLADSYNTVINLLSGDDSNEKNYDKEKKWSTAYGALLFLLIFLLIWGVFNVWSRSKNNTKNWR